MSGLTKPSKTLCPHCFSTSVSCQAWINPNNHQIDEYVKDSFQSGQCFSCGKSGELIRIDLNQQTIDNKYQEYIRHHKEEPKYVQCLVVFTDQRDYEEHAVIKLSSGIEENDGDTFYFCDSLSNLKSLCDKGVENFVIRKIYCFDNQ